MDMNRTFDRGFKLKINDDDWNFFLITEEESEELEDGFRALTYTGEDGKAVFLVEGNVTKNVIAHELFHVYVYYFHLDSAGIDTDAFEEVVAEFLEANLDKFVRIRNKIYKKFKELEGS